LPIEAIGAEARREHSTGFHPAPNRLHVWWARRPLITRRAAILTGVLLAWSPDFPAHLHEKFPSMQSYQQWFIVLCGIFGESAKVQKLGV